MKTSLAFLFSVAALVAGCDDDDTAAGDDCGGLAGGDCTGDQFCNYQDTSCAIADGTGVCQPRPTVCTPVITPVCGCDGNRYNNECEAQRAGTDVSTSNSCK